MNYFQWDKMKKTLLPVCSCLISHDVIAFLNGDKTVNISAGLGVLSCLLVLGWRTLSAASPLRRWSGLDLCVIRLSIGHEIVVNLKYSHVA